MLEITILPANTRVKDNKLAQKVQFPNLIISKHNPAATSCSLKCRKVLQRFDTVGWVKGYPAHKKSYSDNSQGYFGTSLTGIVRKSRPVKQNLKAAAAAVRV